MMNKTVKKSLALLIKISLTLMIFAFLFYQAHQNDAFSKFWNRPKNWGYLSLAFLANFVALSITIIRWQFLLNAIGVPLKWKEAFRIGYLSFLFNLAPVGIVTGDGIRFYMLFHQFPETRAKSFASIIMDRAVGLYIMFLIAVVAIFATGFYAYSGAPGEMVFITTIVRIMLILLGIATMAALLVLLPDLTRGTGAKLLDQCCGRIPKLKSVILAVQGYRNHKRALFIAGTMTIAVHVLFSLGIWLIALGFYGYAPTAAEHLVLHTVSNVTQLIPLAVGPYEMILDKMYTFFPIADHETYRQGYGLLIALGYRLISILLGGIGVLYYFFGLRTSGFRIQESEDFSRKNDVF
jgi:uncharacterized protein (TIRG00374 family)